MLVNEWKWRVGVYGDIWGICGENRERKERTMIKKSKRKNQQTSDDWAYGRVNFMSTVLGALRCCETNYRVTNKNVFVIQRERGSLSAEKVNSEHH